MKNKGSVTLTSHQINTPFFSFFGDKLKFKNILSGVTSCNLSYIVDRPVIYQSQIH